MDSTELLKLCEKELLERGFTDNVENIKLVWFAKTIQNSKALLFILNANVEHDFIEVTYHGDKKELYLDCYEKMNKIIVEVE